MWPHGGAGPCVYTAQAALPKQHPAWLAQGRHILTAAACCRIDQLNGELMAIAPLGRGSSSAAAVGKAEPGALGHGPRGCCKSQSWSSSHGHGCWEGVSCPQAGLVHVWAQSSVCLCMMLQHCWLCSGEQRCLLGTTCDCIPHWAQGPRTVCGLHPCLMVPTLLVPTAQRGARGISVRVHSSQLPPAPGVRGKRVTLPSPCASWVQPEAAGPSCWCPFGLSTQVPIVLWSCVLRPGQDGTNWGCESQLGAAADGAGTHSG